MIDYIDTFNFLGVYIDKTLRWNSHIDFIACKISKVIGMLNKLKHFLPPNILLSIYNALIVPHLNYGNILWGNKNTKIFDLQKKAIRVITLSKINISLILVSYLKNLGFSNLEIYVHCMIINFASSWRTGSYLLISIQCLKN